MGRSRDLANLISGQGTLPNGSIPSGSVIQVVQTQDASNSKLTAPSNGGYADTTLTVSITPKSIGNTFIISGSFCMSPHSTSVVVASRIVRVVNSVSTVISPVSTGSSSSTTLDGWSHVYNTVAPSVMGTNWTPFFIKDSGSISPLEHTYKLQIGASDAAHNIHYNQYGEAAVFYEDTWTPVSQMMVMEIKA